MSKFYRVWGRTVTDNSFQSDVEGKEAALIQLYAYVAHAKINKSKERVDLEFERAMRKGERLTLDTDYDYISVEEISSSKYMSPEDYQRALDEMHGLYDDEY